MQTKWPNNKKYKREKMAEVLIPTCISPEHIKNLRVLNKFSGERLNSILNRFIKKNPTIDLSHLAAIKCYVGDEVHYFTEVVHYFTNEEIVQL